MTLHPLPYSLFDAARSSFALRAVLRCSHPGS